MLRRVASFAAHPEDIEGRRRSLDKARAVRSWLPSPLLRVIGVPTAQECLEESVELRRLATRFR